MRKGMNFNMKKTEQITKLFEEWKKKQINESDEQFKNTKGNATNITKANIYFF